jgi:hypothetical protein
MLQTTPPKRESLARATALYYERKATSEAGTPLADSEASTPNAAAGKVPSRSPYRSNSMGGAQAAVGIRSLPIQQLKAASAANLASAAEHVPAAGSLSARRFIKASSEGGVRPTGAASADAPPANVTSASVGDEQAEAPTAGTAAVSAAEATGADPVAAFSDNDAADVCTPVKVNAGQHTPEQEQQLEQQRIRQLQTEPRSMRTSLSTTDRGQQQQQQQQLQETTPRRNRLALFHSPQASKQPSFRRGSDSGCRKGPVKALAAGFDAAAAAGGGAGGMRSYRARSEAGAASGKGATAAAAVSRSGSSKWQQLGGASKPAKTTPVSKSEFDGDMCRDTVCRFVCHQHVCTAASKPLQARPAAPAACASLCIATCCSALYTSKHAVPNACCMHLLLLVLLTQVPQSRPGHTQQVSSQ